MPTLLDQYADYLRAAGASDRTVTDRIGAARRLLARAGTDDPTAITFTDALAYIGSVAATASRATYYQHTKSFGRFCHAAGLDVTFDRHLPAVRFPRGVPRPTPTNDLIAALTVADVEAAMMLRLAALQGMRVSEIARVRGEDVGAVTYVTGKGGKREMIPTHPSVLAAARHFPCEGEWFVDFYGRPASRWVVWRRMTEALRAVGSDATPHQCRHWYGTALVESGADLRTVQTLLRHESLNTTQIYTRVTDIRRREAVDALPTLG